MRGNDTIMCVVHSHISKAIDFYIVITIKWSLSVIIDKQTPWNFSPVRAYGACFCFKYILFPDNSLAVR